MKLIDRIFGKVEPKKQAPEVDADFGMTGTYRELFVVSYDGEKNLGEIGPLKHYMLDYEALRLRSWEASLTSDIAQIALTKQVTWVIGSGLKLQCEPNKTVLKSEGVTLNPEEFNTTVEARFKVFCNSKKVDYAGQSTLNQLANTAYKNSVISGDVLVVLRYEKKQITVQLVDASAVCSPGTNNPFYMEAVKNQNRVLHGIEISPKGEHLAYFVKIAPLQWERIPAKGAASGRKMAFLVYGRKHRIDNHRGIPVLSTVLESLSKLERYKEATIGSAEERQKIVYFIQHGINSTGEDPREKALTKGILLAHDADAKTEIPLDVNANQLADTIAATTNKTTFNMPQDSKLETLESKNELYFKDFFTTNFNFFCAAIEQPPEVALSMYNSNYSASRAAIKDWGHNLDVKRKYFSDQFFQEVYNFWLYIEILNFKVQAPGYLKAIDQGNDMIIEAYQAARFIGPGVPQIDPVKEVTAIRSKLGVQAAAIPLMTVEQAIEELGYGDTASTFEQFSKEVESAKKLKIVLPEPTVPAPRKT